MHKKIAYGGMTTALAVLMLVLSAYLPTAKAATLFLASALVYGYRLTVGVKASALVYGASAILGFLICFGASPFISISYVICFGNYPVLRKFTENRPVFAKVILRGILYSLYFGAVLNVSKYFIPDALMFSPLVLYIIGAVLFAAYDVLLFHTGGQMLRLFYQIKR